MKNCYKDWSQFTLLTNVSVKANSVNPDQTAPVGAVWSGSRLFNQEAFKPSQQTTFVETGTLRVIKNKWSLTLDTNQSKKAKRAKIRNQYNQVPHLTQE